MSSKARTAEATLRESPRMIELMELAATRLMRQHLRDGESSVSVEMNVTYAAPGNFRVSGGAVRAVASYCGMSGRLHRFAVNAFDESGLIGSCEHTRAVVIERRLSATARRSAGRASMLLNA